MFSGPKSSLDISRVDQSSLEDSDGQLTGNVSNNSGYSINISALSD